MTNETFIKDPSARKDYQVDWSAWLGVDTISESSWTVPMGLTQYGSDTVNDDDTVTIIWLSGGTPMNDYVVTNQITTAGGRIDQKSFTLKIREQ